MEKYAWKALLIEGKLEEYKRRHREIWSEMEQVLTEAGIRNYSIWIVGNEIFGYYECEQGADFATSIQKNSPIVDRWNEYMKEVMYMEMDPVTGAQPKLENVWNFR